MEYIAAGSAEKEDFKKHSSDGGRETSLLFKKDDEFNTMSSPSLSLSTLDLFKVLSLRKFLQLLYMWNEGLKLQGLIRWASTLEEVILQATNQRNSSNLF